MKAILKIENPEMRVGVYSHVLNDADDVLYPVLVNGMYYHLRIHEGRWTAIGLSDDLTAYIGEIIDQELNYD